MSPGAVHRPSKVKGEKRLVRYYVSQRAMRQGYKHCPIKTINATHIDALVRALLLDYLDGQDLKHLRQRDREARDFWIREIIDRVVLAPGQMTIDLNSERIEACRDVEWPDLKTDMGASLACLYKPTVENRRSRVVLTLGIQIKRLDGKRQLLSPNGQDLIMPAEPEPKNHIVIAIGNAYRWRELLMQDNLTLKQLADRVGFSDSQIRKYLPLINLSPDILRRALTGRLPSTATMMRLLAAAKHLNWDQQAHFLGLDPSS
ncbi:MAG: hypothetical protein AAGG38_00470 [Planctomycetota bacterium]